MFICGFTVAVRSFQDENEKRMELRSLREKVEWVDPGTGCDVDFTSI